MLLSRSNQNVLSEWWYTVDRMTLAVALLLVGIGIIVCTTASTPMATRLHVGALFFFKKHLGHAICASALMIGVSFLQRWQLKLAAVVGLIFFWFLTSATPFVGAEIKGAKRWLSLHGMYIQPSELLRPCLVLVNAWLLERAQRNGYYYVWSAALCLLCTVSLCMQPDIGMATMMLAVWAAQIFLSRLSFTWILGASAVLLSCIFVAYMTFAHVRQRVDNFLLAGSGSEHYQVVKSLEAFSSGGVLGLGPGRGVIKNSLPDGHADFVLAVIGEEFGTVACICIILSYLVISFSCIMRARAMDSEFCISAAIGLALQLHLQALVNIGVVIRLLPTTGVTLPLISYGGSSMMATGMTVGAMLALTRHRALLL